MAKFAGYLRYYRSAEMDIDSAKITAGQIMVGFYVHQYQCGGQTAKNTAALAPLHTDRELSFSFGQIAIM